MSKRRFTFEEIPEEPRSTSEEPEDKKKKRKSRWGGEEKVNIPGLSTILPSTLTAEQQEIYILHLRLEEISRKLRAGEVVPPDNERSPSPEPTYDAQGNRSNTREKRYKKKLEEERGKLIELLMRKNPEFKPPVDYKKTKVTDKVWIPQKEYPDVNFIGQLLGPRGNTLKKMEADSGGVKIFIRGKGSIKEGKAVTGPIPGEDEELHAMVSGDTEEQVQKAVKMINEIIELGKSVPEQDNERKKLQLRELAALNGTLREDESGNVIIQCKNCGEMGHHMKDCTSRKNITQVLYCTLCNSGGHLRKDCVYNTNPQLREQHKELDQEYVSLMKELGEEIPPHMLPPGPPGVGRPAIFPPGTGPPGMGRPPAPPGLARPPFPNQGLTRPPFPRPQMPGFPQPWAAGQQAPWPGAWPGAPAVGLPLPPPGTAPLPLPAPPGAAGQPPLPPPGAPPPGSTYPYGAYSYGYPYPGPPGTSAPPPPPGTAAQPPLPPGTAGAPPPPPSSDKKGAEGDKKAEDPNAAAYQAWYDPNYQQYYQWNGQAWGYQ